MGDATTGEFVSLSGGHTKPVKTAAWSWDGQQLATAGDEPFVVTWDAAKRTVQKKLEHPCPVVALAWSHDGAWLATGGTDRQIRVWETRAGQLQRTLGPLPVPLGSNYSDYPHLSFRRG